MPNVSSTVTPRQREVVTTSKELSIRLAEAARSIRDRIASALIHDGDGEADADGFADMYAQTIACSLLAARIVDPHRKTAGDVAVPKIDFGELDVSDVVDLLDRADMDAVVRDFANRNPLEDPVIHFYELFLKEYDPKKRMRRGVFYTPRPVVSYIVRSVDELLRREFGLADGLADTSSWAEVVGRCGHLTVPEGVSPEQDFVRILDPATGTGTFLFEVIDSIHRTLIAKWRARGHGDAEIDARWNDYVQKHLLTRLHGCELLMAPCAIAHLKVGLALHETGYRFAGDECVRVRVSLANALECTHSTDRERGIKGGPGMECDRRFTVVLGNPPYANYSANLSAEARRIVDKYRTFNGAPIRERNQLQFERNIQGDFVKFIALAQDMIAASGAGVVAYITNATMLASPSLRGMRQSLVKDFTRIYELNLLGGSNESTIANRADENVFDIVQSVAIHVYARTKPGGASIIHLRGRLRHASRKTRRLRDAIVGCARVAVDRAGRRELRLWQRVATESNAALTFPGPRGARLPGDRRVRRGGSARACDRRRSPRPRWRGVLGRRGAESRAETSDRGGQPGLGSGHRARRPVATARPGVSSTGSATFAPALRLATSTACRGSR